MKSSEVCRIGGLVIRVECRSLTGEVSGSVGGCVRVSEQGGCSGDIRDTSGVTVGGCGDGLDEPRGVVGAIG